MTSAIRVVAAVLIDGGQVLAARRGPQMKMPGLWELPGGKVEAGEADRAALRRELEEELGIHTEVGDFVAEVRHRYGETAIHLLAYRCRQIGGQLEAREHSALQWVGADGLADLDWAAADIPLVQAVRALLTTP